MNDRLNTVQKLLLLAHHSEKGRFKVANQFIHYGIIGAILLDLLEMKLVVMKDDKVQLTRKVKSLKAPGYNMVYERLQNARKAHKPKYWIQKLGSKGRAIKWEHLELMAEKEIVRIEQKKFLGLFPYKKSYLLDHQLREKLIGQAHKAILSDKPLKEDELALLGLVQACKLHQVLATDKREAKKLRKQMKQVLRDSPVAESVDQSIKAMQAAVVAATAGSVVAVTAGSSN